MGPFTREAYGGFKYASKITDQFTRWTRAAPSTPFACSSHQLSLLVDGRVIRWRAGKGGEYTSEAFKQDCLEMGITQEFAATSTPQKNGMSERVGRTLCSKVRCLLVDSELPPKLWGELMLSAV